MEETSELVKQMKDVLNLRVTRVEEAVQKALSTGRGNVVSIDVYSNPQDIFCCIKDFEASITWAQLVGVDIVPYQHRVNILIEPFYNQFK